jgi:hypothetical protein
MKRTESVVDYLRRDKVALVLAVVVLLSLLGLIGLLIWAW